MDDVTTTGVAPAASLALALRVKEQARALGFELVGVADASPPAHAEFLAEWISREMHGAMGYMARDLERRMDPARSLAGARAVVVAGKNYYVPRGRVAAASEGTISRYAWGDDYHDVLLDRLHDLRRFIESIGGHAKVAVDTAPILEKLWAAKAGLGWQGKHSNVISLAFASWLFLGEVITDLPLPADPPFAHDRCGRCTRCIDACPTRAIVAPYVVDARLCISYLTIEHHGAIPRELRPLMGNLIFGCDICQDVCPWNKFARKAPDAAFLPREGNLVPLLAEWASMTDAEFRARFRKSPIRRAKRAGFVRNVVIALGNSRDEAAAAPLARALDDADPLVRLHAAWALGRIATPAARAALERRRAHEDDPAVSEEIALALNETRWVDHSP